MNPLSNFANHISNVVCYGALCGGLGYLAHRVINQINPYAGLVCGAVAGATTVLFFNENANLARKTIGVAILVFAPQKICEYLQLPVTIQACLAVTGVTVALAIFFQTFHQKRIKEQNLLGFEIEFEKMEHIFELDKVQVQTDDKKTAEKKEKEVESIQEDSNDVTEEMPNRFKENQKKLEAELKKKLAKT